MLCSFVCGNSFCGMIVQTSEANPPPPTPFLTPFFNNYILPFLITLNLIPSLYPTNMDI